MTGTYAQTWDLDTLAPSPDSEAFRVSIDSYRQELDELADSADSYQLSIGSPRPYRR